MGQLKQEHRSTALTRSEALELQDKLGRPITWRPNHIHQGRLSIAREEAHEAGIDVG